MRFTQNRIDDIIDMGILTGKSVLEFGCVGMGNDDEYGGVNWIHGKVKEVAKKVIGLDLNEKGINKLKNLGYDVRLQNVEEKFDLKEKFDVVLVEEVFEHLNNVGLALENIKRHLKKDGLLVITTPHAQSASFFLQRLFRDEISGVSITDHTLWYDKNTLNTILKRYNFKIQKIWYVQPKPIKYSLFGLIIRFFLTPLPNRVSRNLCCIAKKID
jgi:2-polyprenyl-3-methyl-5-hydroxy-6-metoxy-1,4-benzoquinol methylase